MAAALFRLSRKTLSSAPFCRSLSSSAVPATDRINWDSEAYNGEDLLKCLELTRHFENAVLPWTWIWRRGMPSWRVRRVSFSTAGKLLRPQTLKPHHHRSNSKDPNAKKSNHLALIEIGCGRSAEELLAARAEYHQRFKRTLEEDVADHTKGDFRKDLW